MLGVGSGVRVFELTFTQDVDGRPVALSQMYLRPQATVKLEQMCAAEDQLPVLVERGPDVPDQLADRYGIAVAVSDVTVELTQMNEFEAALLSATLGSPAFLVSALDLDAAEAPVSFTRTVIRGERFRFSLALRHRDAQGMNRSPGFVACMT